MGSPAPHAFADRTSLVAAVGEWNANATAAEAIYGNVSHWNVSNITDMDYLFDQQNSFNEPLHWDTSSVTRMHGMFAYASSFNQPLVDWDTSRVTSMQDLFYVRRSDSNPGGPICDP